MSMSRKHILCKLDIVRTVEPDLAIQKWNKLFPFEFEGATLSCRNTAWVPRLGLIAHLSLYRPVTYEGPLAEVVIVKDLADLDDTIKRFKKLVKKLDVKKAFEEPLHEVLDLPLVSISTDTFLPAKEDEARRKKALAASLKRFPAVSQRMKEVYGLRLPKQVAVWDAFEKSLSPIERVGLNEIGRGRGGIMLWFEDGGLEKKTVDNLDARLEARFRRDPPELVTVMWGDTDGLHYGLWYDDPEELPSFIVHNYARDSAETWRDEEATLLGILRERTRKLIEEPDYPEEPIATSLYALRAALDWWTRADDEVFEKSKWTDHKRGEILGGVAPALPKSAGNARATYKEYNERAEAYRASSPKVEKWIAEARAELAKGKPAFALTLGRELHWMDSDETRALSLELMTAAWEALGRPALANVARVHHQHRDLKTVSVYE
jgi:hypothetical protein